MNWGEEAQGQEIWDRGGEKEVSEDRVSYNSQLRVTPSS